MFIADLQNDVVMSNLRSSLLVRDKAADKWIANFDPQMLTHTKEMEHMIQLGLDIPPAAKALASRQEDIAKLYQSVSVRYITNLQ